MRCLLKLSVVTASLFLVTTSAIADLTATANKPMYDGPKAGKHRLDQCWMLGKNCGKDAADKYCQIQGYENAKSFETEKASPTQTLVGEPCTGSVCVAFRSITCVTTAKEQGRVQAWPQLMH